MTADPWTAMAKAELAFGCIPTAIPADIPAPRAVESAPLPAVWCGARAPHLDLVLCRRLINHPGLHTSDGADDWSGPVRVSPPTTDEETNRA